MDCKEIMKKAKTIKEITINQIDLVLSQKKKYYRNDEFPFPKQKNGYSTHQGAVMRQYLRQKGYVNVRVSEISKDFFNDNILYVRKLSDYNKFPYLKCSNTIILLKSDFENYSIVKQKRDEFAKKPKVKPILIGMGKVSRKQDLIDKYVERLDDYTQFLKAMGHTLTKAEKIDCLGRLSELRGFIIDLKSL